MISKKTRARIGALDTEVVASYLTSLGWAKLGYVPKDNCASYWFNETWTDEQKKALHNARFEDKVTVMLPHHKHYGDYERCMVHLFGELSSIYDKCECELLKEVVES